MGFNGELADTGWIQLPSSLSGWGIQYRVRNGVCFVLVNGLDTIPDSATPTVLTSSPLPAAYRPPTGARAGAYFGGFPGILTVTAAGHVEVVQQTGASRGSAAAVLSYPVD